MRRSRHTRDPGSRFDAPPNRPAVLSVVMPVYNEASTVAEVIDGVLGFELTDATIELVIVESKSIDGSREIVAKYEDSPRTKVVYQEQPRGKGFAVREGFEHATGDIILIQDADLEYSLDDYPTLFEPIMQGRADFALGCRHVRGRPMRVMPEDRWIGWVVNTAHWGFTWLFDAFYFVRLRDPFTMYKVFRSECIEGVEFVADRFDFDWELVAKLIRLGYRPLEIPVSYTARSFAGGKKVRFFRDPPSWIAACIRFRFSKITRQKFRHASRRGARS